MSKPIFPVFETFELRHMSDVQRINNSTLPYSDFNFVSLFSWNTYETAKVSFFEENVIFKFKDYISDEEFVTFTGSSCYEMVADMLLDMTKLDKTLMPYLKLVPEHIANELLLSNKYNIEEDRDNHDYIVRVDDLLTLEGTKYLSKRNHLHQFHTHHADQTRIVDLDLSSQEVQKDIIELFRNWAESHQKTEKEINNELQALRRLLAHAHHFELVALGVYLSSANKLIGFCIAEPVHNSFAMFHFEKALPGFAGIYEYLAHKLSEKLSTYGVKYINFEQDLGLPGLRQAKEGYKPDSYLKKYIVTGK